MNLYKRVDIFVIFFFALADFVPTVDTSQFFGIQFGVDLVTSSDIVKVNFIWREIWNASYATTTLLTTSTVNVCQSCSERPYPLYITLSTATSNCQQTVTTASSVAYDSRTGIDTTISFTSLQIPTFFFPNSSTYYSMGFSNSAWGLVTATTTANYGAQIDVLLNRRADTGNFDGSARSAIAPIVTIRPACGGNGFQIPYYDPDGDPVQCRWGTTTQECQSVCSNKYAPTYVTMYPFKLSPGCYLTYTGTPTASSVYWPIAVMLEDYYPLPPYKKMDSAPVEFVVEVAPPNSPCAPVSPLVVDNCSLAMAPISVCPSNITNAPANSYVSSSSYSVLTNSTANLTCNYGYVPMPTAQIYMICSAYNVMVGVWTAVGNCTGTRHPF